MAVRHQTDVLAELIGILLIAGGLLLGASLISYHPQDPSFLATAADGDVRNLTGRVGAYTSDLFIVLFGVGSFLIPPYLVIRGVRRMIRREPVSGGRVQQVIGVLLLFISVPILSQLYFEEMPFLLQPIAQPQDPGGLIGRLASDALIQLFAPLGTYLIVWTALLLSLLMTTSLSLNEFLMRLVQVVGDSLEHLYRAAMTIPKRLRQRPRKNRPVLPPRRPPKIIESVAVTPPAPLPAPRAESPKPAPPDGEYAIPPLSLLQDPPDAAPGTPRETLLDHSRFLEKRLLEFGVASQVTAVHPGPVVTLYELQPAPGVKVQKITVLADDLALAMKAMSVRIVAPLPGRSTVGIEIPNETREVVLLKDILTTPAYQEIPDKEDSASNGTPKKRLKLALGKDIFGNPVVVDLAGLPHLLVAGATGSGKSVALNTMILSLLFAATPQQVQLILIDPKRLELSGYEEIPHLLTPVIYKPKEAARVLQKMVQEMQRRYRILAEQGVRSIESYNQKISPDQTPLPYIVIVVDELADLMLTAGRDVEDTLIRLAQMARAAGIHLIVATQRPSVEVLTGIIKANFSARISFQVSTKTDSRTILDANGAEQLLGRGDMLWMPPGGTKLTRVHGTYVSEGEIQKVVKWIRDQRAAEYQIPQDEITASAGASQSGDERDELYQQAIQMIMETGQASASFIQRRMRVGYPRAARMIEIMEEDGIIGPPVSGKPREVYIKPTDPLKLQDPFPSG